MKRTFKSLFLFVLFFFTTCIVVDAKPVSKEAALKVASNFFRINLNKTTDRTVLNYTTICSKQKAANVLLHVFYGDNSYIIIAADDNTYPVLAYSTDAPYPVNSEVSAFNWWITNVADATEQASKSKAKVDNEIKEAWDTYTSFNKTGNNPNNTKAVNPLLNTTWNQGQGYNAACPSHQMGPGGKCYAGCVATAMAQVMKFYNYPKRGQGSHTYFHPSYGNITANFDTVYDWNYMTPPSINNSTHPEAIAKLIYHCGVAVEMYYTPTGSSAILSYALDALYNNFKYRRFIKYISRSAYTDAQWRTILMDNLDMGYPILYGGQDATAGGHAFVCDGYQSNNYFHFNWGWSGAANGYFYTNNLNTGNGNFVYSQDAIINIVPDSSIYPLCIPNKKYAAQSWTFSNGSGTSNYENNTGCQWLLKPDSGDYLQIRFNRFKTEANHDFVTIYDGENTNAPVLGTYSGTNIPSTIVTSSAKALVVFTSDGANANTGWELTYNTLYNCKPQRIINSLDTIFDNGSGYLNNYANRTNCQWLVKADNYRRIQLRFQRFETEPNKDYLTVYDGETTAAPVLGSYSGFNMPADIFSSSNKLLLVFISDTINTFNGWMVESIVLDSASTAGFNSGAIAGALRIFPNPATDRLNISGDFVTEGITKFSIFNIQGVMQYADESYFKAGNVSKSIDVGNLSKGIYFLKIENTNAISYLKFIIK